MFKIFVNSSLLSSSVLAGHSKKATAACCSCAVESLVKSGITFVVLSFQLRFGHGAGNAGLSGARCFDDSCGSNLAVNGDRSYSDDNYSYPRTKKMQMMRTGSLTVYHTEKPINISSKLKAAELAEVGWDKNETDRREPLDSVQPIRKTIQTRKHEFSRKPVIIGQKKKIFYVYMARTHMTKQQPHSLNIQLLTSKRQLDLTLIFLEAWRSLCSSSFEDKFP